MQPALKNSDSPAFVNESCFLGAYLLSFSFEGQDAKDMRVRMLEIVKANMFLHRAHKIVFDAIVVFMMEGKTPEAVLLQTYLSGRNQLADIGGTEYLIAMIDKTPNPMAGEEYAKNVRECWKRRSVKKVLTDLMLDVDQGEKFGEELDVLGTINKAIASVADSSLGEAIRNGAEVVNTCLNMDFSKSKLAVSGIQKLDENLNLMAPGHLNIIAARASVGKSTLMRQIARETSHTGRLLIFSMEVPCDILTLQFVCELSGVPFYDYTQKQETITDEQREAMVDAACHPMFERLEFYVKSPVSTMEVSLAISRLQAQGHTISAVLIDYLGLMKHEKAERKDISIGNTTKALKELAIRHKLPVILLAQINREADKRGGDIECARPRLSDLRDSGDIEQDADNVILLWRKERGDEFKSEEPRVLTVAKSRLGRAFELDLMFNKPNGEFYAVGLDGIREQKRPAPVAEWYSK